VDHIPIRPAHSPQPMAVGQDLCHARIHDTFILSLVQRSAARQFDRLQKLMSLPKPRRHNRVRQRSPAGDQARFLGAHDPRVVLWLFPPGGQAQPVALFANVLWPQTQSKLDDVNADQRGQRPRFQRAIEKSPAVRVGPPCAQRFQSSCKSGKIVAELADRIASIRVAPNGQCFLRPSRPKVSDNWPESSMAAPCCRIEGLSSI
jgi:hypothetical protein